MGCDCHFYTEKWTNQKNYEGPKDTQTDRDIKLNNILQNEEYQHQEYAWVTADTWHWNDTYWGADEYYDDRNYFLFAILADVRNGYGIEPLSEPRGVPADSCYPIKYIVNEWEGDGHSHSYFTLKELLDVDWSKYCVKLPEVDRTDWLDDFKQTLNILKEIDSNPENVRCVFFFDN
jgi:hypothetical protein